MTELVAQSVSYVEREGASFKLTLGRGPIPQRTVPELLVQQARIRGNEAGVQFEEVGHGDSPR